MLHTLLIQSYSLGSKIILGILFTILVLIVLNYAFRMIEMAYVLKKRRPLYTHFYIYLRQLNKNQKFVLENQFSFYKKLTKKEKRYFEHRVASFIKDKDFIGREGNIITDEMKVLVASTAVMLTFGFRDFYIGIISRIVIYPEKFYSNTNDAFHKGEFNPRFKSLVLSWEDFVEGYKYESDNLNLGIHEFTHAIHLNSLEERDVSSIVFSDSFKELSKLLAPKSNLKEKIMASDYFRNYAFTNQFEFLAVAIENFIETPQTFKMQFPQIYNKVKQMLNFNIAGY